jgi:trimethylamine---corrinoid protein Co-methyltransferase
MVAAHLRYSDKPFMGSVTAEDRAEDSIEMARIVFGSDFVDSHCVIMGNINANSPLVYDATMTKSLRPMRAPINAP